MRTFKVLRYVHEGSEIGSWVAQPQLIEASCQADAYIRASRELGTSDLQVEEVIENLPKLDTFRYRN